MISSAQLLSPQGSWRLIPPLSARKHSYPLLFAGWVDGWIHPSQTRECQDLPPSSPCKSCRMWEHC